jgi:hypothetical protein
MEKYIINKDLYFEAWSWQRSGRWGHKARAVYQNRVTEEVSITYQNRTWEAYKFQSVMEKLIDRLDAVHYVPLADRIEASKVIKTGDRREMKKLQSIGAIAMLGGIIGGNTTKQRIIASIPGVIVPDDFDSLDENEKTRRLNGAINILTEK